LIARSNAINVIIAVATQINSPLYDRNTQT